MSESDGRPPPGSPTPEPRSAPADIPPRGDWKNLGASLVLTGVLGMIAGTGLHFALRAQAIDSTVHLGYVIGLVGLLVFLIGVVLVY